MNNINTKRFKLITSKSVLSNLKIHDVLYYLNKGWKLDLKYVKKVLTSRECSFCNNNDELLDNSLKNLEKTIDMNLRLKNELNVDSRDYWKNTHKALHKISERLVKLAGKVGQLR